MKQFVGELFVLGFQGPQIPNWMMNFAKEFSLGGVLLFDYSVQTRTYENNIFDKQQVKDLCTNLHALPSKPLLYVDQEGGKVRRLKERLGFAPLPSAQNFPALPLADRKTFLANSFREMRELGFHIDLGPCIDMNTNPQNPDIGAVERSFSADANVVKENARLWIEAARAQKLGLCLKHFPGCGGASVNSHLELMDLTGTFSETQLNLFKELGSEIPGQMILLSHGVVNDWEKATATSMSKKAVSLLRSWNPNAVLMTDDLQMQGLQKLMNTEEGCLKAIRAGLDLLCIGNNLMNEEKSSFDFAERLIRESEKEAALAQNIRASIQRLKNLKKSLS